MEKSIINRSYAVLFSIQFGKGIPGCGNLNLFNRESPRKTGAGKMKTILRVPVKKSVGGYPISRMNCSTLLRISSGERGIFGDAEFPGRIRR